ncbi:MAG: ImmA/IrrE family metallo-endopeptidase [Clostridia bacterium]|nr:ImmA/IrrE family metallo-endopeptidase [Clostridia bacterium]
MAMYLEYETYEYIKGEAVAVFKQYSDLSYPINAFAVAKDLGIIVVPYSSLADDMMEKCMQESKDGFYYPGDFFDDENTTDHIYYNDSQVESRITYTILHEIGHVVLDHEPTTNRGLIDDDRREAEANFFAKYILAPPPLVNLIMPQGPKDIVKWFHVSKEAGQYEYTYYQKWLDLPFHMYTEYESYLIDRFACCFNK